MEGFLTDDLLFTEVDARESLKSVIWAEGKKVPLISGPYRYQIVVVCSLFGRQKAIFADGKEHNYFGYVRIVGAKGEWRGEGGIIVPVLPNGQILMVVEQRPPRYAFANQPEHLELRHGQKISRVPLRKFGPYSSVEFPGGAVEVGEKLSAGFLLELTSETGVRGGATLYRKRFPHYPFLSDLATRDFLSVVYLDQLGYVPKTDEDGGLHILALWPDEVVHNIRNGVIASAHAALLPWAFYQEIAVARVEKNIQELVEEGYIEIGEVTLE